MKPILFSTPMVQAILDGRKTMTRRVIKQEGWQQWIAAEADNAPYRAGDILWVRETWYQHYDGAFAYRASSSFDTKGWRPSIFMPREACRIFLRVIEVRAERLQDMPLFDVWSEGTPQMPGNTDSDGAVNHQDYRYLWDKLNAKRGYGWDTNPWVCVITFERCEKPEAHNA